jgi:cytochrome c oxidase subunit I+III
MFVGFNVAFFPMHVTGLAGMPRRVYTYPAGLGWEALNLASTIGAFMMAAGILLFLIDMARRFRMSSEGNAGNVWNAGTLEWLPNGNYSNRSIPIVHGTDPLWDDPQLAEHVREGRYYLPNAPTGGRETIVTHPVTAEPQWLMRMPNPGWAPLLAAWFTAGFFLLLTVKLVVLSALCGVIALAALLHWAWHLDPAPLPEKVDIGGGVRLPTYMSGPQSQAWWAMVILMLVAASLYGCVLFTYLYLWTVAPGSWPSVADVPPITPASAVAVLLAASSGAVGYGNRRLARGRSTVPAWALAIVLFAGAFVLDLYVHRDLAPSSSAYAASVGLILAMEGLFGAVVILMGGFAAVRDLAGRVDRVRRVTFDNARLFWHYAVAQSLLGLALVHAFPRLVG